MKEVTLEELLAAGCHFGHQVTRSNPKARDFVFEARDNIQIIDLAKTKEGLDLAAEFAQELGKRGGTLLVVATKRQARQIVDEEIARVKEVLKAGKIDTSGNLFYVTQRWVGGILTNFEEVSKNFKKLDDLKTKLTNKEEQQNYTKKEIGLWDKEKQRLEGLYAGIASLKQKPDALFIVDSHLEHLAVSEATESKVTTVAIVDTNADPFLIDYPIPANDDAVGSIKLIVSHILDAFAQGSKTVAPIAKESPKEEANPKAEVKSSTSAKKAVKTPKAKEKKAPKSAPKAKKTAKIKTKK